MVASGQGPSRAPRLTVEERRRIVLDTATRLFTQHGVHAVGMDRLIAETGLSKMSVYRVFATKDELVGAYLDQLRTRIFELIDRDVEDGEDPRLALHAILTSIEADVRRPDFRGCPFGNAAAEYDDLEHPARRIAQEYRQGLLDRLQRLTSELDPDEGRRLARQLAVIIDGAYLSAAHLGAGGPASEGIVLARSLIDETSPE